VSRNAVIDIRSCKVTLRRAGAGEPLLFLHGAQGLHADEPALDLLEKHFDVVAPDHPGCGRSDNSDLVDSVADLALFYLDLLDALRLDRVHVMGHCIGGWVALEMAVTSSARFKSLVLLNSAGLRVPGLPRGDMFVCSEADLLRMLFANGGGSEWLNRWRTTPDSEDIYDRNRAAAAKYSWSPRLCNPKLDRWLHRVAVPTHILAAQADGVIPPAYAEALQKLIAGATIATLPGCAHLAHLEQPGLVAQEVRQFIQRVAS
jgi:pimeloyl-ACP methyl ester carboxylesterase